MGLRGSQGSSAKYATCPCTKSAVCYSPNFPMYMWWISHVACVSDRQTQRVEPGSDEPLGEVSESQVEAARLDVR